MYYALFAKLDGVGVERASAFGYRSRARAIEGCQNHMWILMGAGIHKWQIRKVETDYDHTAHSRLRALVEKGRAA